MIFDKRTFIINAVRALSLAHLLVAVKEIMGWEGDPEFDPISDIHDAWAVWKALPERIYGAAFQWEHIRYGGEENVCCQDVDFVGFGAIVDESDKEFGIAVCRAMVIATMLNKVGTRC